MPGKKIVKEKAQEVLLFDRDQNEVYLYNKTAEREREKRADFGKL